MTPSEYAERCSRNRSTDNRSVIDIRVTHGSHDGYSQVCIVLAYPLLLSFCFSRASSIDAANHVERLLGQVVVLTLDDLLEAPDRPFEGDDLAFKAGEPLGDEEQLAKKAMETRRPAHNDFVHLRTSSMPRMARYPAATCSADSSIRSKCTPRS